MTEHSGSVDGSRPVESPDNLPDALPPPDEITALDGIALSQAIAAGKVSCAEVMQSYLARISRVNPVYNALVALRDPDDLLREARALDSARAAPTARGWLHGIPQAPKDLAQVAGMVTSMGSRIFAASVPKEDALVIARMRAAGAIFIGRSNVPEFGLGSQTYNAVYGPTRNAHDRNLCAGGSSGGAAVALALHLLPVADGSDMMGSLRNPAAFNGVYGMRPSFGRVPKWPGEQFVQQLGIEGPMARRARDCARLLATQAGPDPRTPLALDESTDEFLAIAHAPLDEGGLAGKRIGWLGDLDGYLATEPGLLARCQRGLERLAALGARVEPTRLGFPPERLWDTWLTLRQGLQGGNLAPFYRDPAQRALLKPEAIWEIEQSFQASAADFYAASQARSDWFVAARALFERFDFIVSPSAQVFPFAVELTWPRSIAGRTMDTYHRWMEVVLPATLAGLPAINLPIARPPEEPPGRQTGIQLIGPPRADAAVLRAAIAYDEMR